MLNVVMLNVMAPKQLLALTPLATQHQLELAWCHDILHKDTQLNDIQHNNIHHKGLIHLPGCQGYRFSPARDADTGLKNVQLTRKYNNSQLNFKLIPNNTVNYTSKLAC